MSGSAQDRVSLGRVHGLFGVRGWVKIYSYTRPPENIFEYDTWELQFAADWRRMRVVDARTQGKKALVALLAPHDGDPLSDRDAAAELLGAEIAVSRDQLPKLPKGEYYAAELLGLRVINTAGEDLGRVSGFLETGANPVLVVNGERERMIPFVRGIYVLDVSTVQGSIEVDWNSDD